MKRFNIFFMLLLLSVTAFASSTNEKIRIGTNLWPGYEPLYIAQALPDWPEDQVRLIRYPSATDVMRAFRNRSIEAAGLTLDEVLTLKESGVKLKVILIMDISNGADAILTKAQYSSIKDLQGKRIVVESSALGAYMLTRALDEHNMSVNDIEISHAEISQHINAYESIETDAIVTFDPAKSHLIQTGAHVLFTSKDIYGEIVDVLVVREDVLENNRVDLKGVVSAWYKALIAIKKKNPWSIALMSKNLGLSTVEVETSLDNLVFPDINENITLISDGSMTQTLTKLKSVMFDSGLLKKIMSIDDLVSPVVLNKVD